LTFDEETRTRWKTYIGLTDPPHFQVKESDMVESPTPTPHKTDHTVALTAIIATVLVLLACVAGCTGVLVEAISRIH